MSIETIGKPYCNDIKGFKYTPLVESIGQTVLDQMLLHCDLYSDVLVHAVLNGYLSAEELFSRGASILESGSLTPHVAGNVLRAILLQDIGDERRLDSGLLKIAAAQGADTTLSKLIKEQRVTELKANIIHLMAQGFINLYPYSHPRLKPPGASERETGLGLDNALGTIPEFNQDFDLWCRRVLSINTVNNATLPHLFTYMLLSLGLDVWFMAFSSLVMLVGVAQPILAQFGVEELLVAYTSPVRAVVIDQSNIE